MVGGEELEFWLLGGRAVVGGKFAGDEFVECGDAGFEDSCAISCRPEFTGLRINVPVFSYTLNVGIPDAVLQAANSATSSINSASASSSFLSDSITLKCSGNRFNPFTSFLISSGVR